MKTRQISWLLAVLGLVTDFAAPRAFAQDGIYADIQTSMGSFTCRLDYAIAPKAVANFIGLATGQKAWLDLTTGVARTSPFFDGITFHRVVTNFVIQAGSRDASGSDGAGYAFVDEFSSSERFNTFGMLGMANSGPDSNSSQFFITMVSATQLNDSYTAFGKVVGGSNVVYAINHVATDSNNKPYTNVVIQDVGIRRVGSAAQAFNINGQGLPVVTNQPLALAKAAGDRWELTWATNRQYADNRLYVSTSLTNWSENKLGIELSTQVTNHVYVSNNVSQAWFRMAQIQYAGSTFAPTNLYGLLFTVALKNAGSTLGTLKITFDSADGGTWSFKDAVQTRTGTVTSYSWTQDPYRGFIWPIYYSGTFMPPMTMQLNFTSETAGTMTGTAYPTGGFSYNIDGKFTLTR